ncbi:MAG: class I SAM-dependent methyltransferase [SAR202 cluster bacterium]|nr:class I SAM-dependent methyltransferase [SAR202 cluster bacterium]
MNTLNKSNLFIKEYTSEFVGRWDELIDWEKRGESEGGFFERVLKEKGAATVLDIASGTGYHTVTLGLNGFDVTGSDGSANMISKAKENAERFGLDDVRLEEAEWTSLSETFTDDKFDAIVCLGNAFTHLFEDTERRTAMDEIYSLLNPGGVAIIDHRNYDSILDNGFSSKHESYYLGDTVDIRPETISENGVLFRYSYADGSVHHLTLCPIRQDYVTSLFTETGFQNVERYGDFESEYDLYDPDFIVQVATK